MKNKIEHTKGSGNIFEDLELSNPVDRLQKAQLASVIYDIIKSKKLTQKKAGEILGITQSKVSALLNGRLDDFSIDRLMRFLGKLDQDVQIAVSPKKKKIAVFTLSYDSANNSSEIAEAAG